MGMLCVLYNKLDLWSLGIVHKRDAKPLHKTSNSQSDKSILTGGAFGDIVVNVAL